MPDRAAVCAGAMTWHAMLPGYSAQYLAAAFPWESSRELSVVDVGGGLGHVSRTLVDYSPTVKCIVEDAPEVILQAQESLSADLRERINFKVHDFFQEQPVKGADVYLLRLILHDWSDKYATMIIKALIPALKPGAKIVVNDRVVPGCGEAHYLVEREARSVPVHMCISRKADPKSTVIRICTCLLSRMAKSGQRTTGKGSSETQIRDLSLLGFVNHSNRTWRS